MLSKIFVYVIGALVLLVLADIVTGGQITQLLTDFGTIINTIVSFVSSGLTAADNARKQGESWLDTFLGWFS